MKEQYKKLVAPFPAEAITKDSSHWSDLTSAEAQYVVDRLNDILGIDGWEIKGGTALKEQYKKLTAPFPAEAITKDSSRGFDLTSVKAQYVVERLNDVLGIDGWEMTPAFKEMTDGVVCQGILKFNKVEMVFQSRREGIGYAAWNDHKLDGDVFKSAQTDCLSKLASHIGVANDVYKGLVKPDGTMRGGDKRKSKPKDTESSASAIDDKPKTRSKKPTETKQETSEDAGAAAVPKAPSKTKTTSLVNSVLRGGR